MTISSVPVIPPYRENLGVGDSPNVSHLSPEQFIDLATVAENLKAPPSMSPLEVSSWRSGVLSLLNAVRDRINTRLQPTGVVLQQRYVLESRQSRYASDSDPRSSASGSGTAY